MKEGREPLVVRRKIEIPRRIRSVKYICPITSYTGNHWRKKVSHSTRQEGTAPLAVMREGKATTHCETLHLSLVS